MEENCEKNDVQTGFTELAESNDYEEGDVEINMLIRRKEVLDSVLSKLIEKMKDPIPDALGKR